MPPILPKALIASFLILFASFAVPIMAADHYKTTGTLEILWGDPQLDNLDPAVLRVQLRADNGEVLLLDASGTWPRSLHSLSGRQVEVTVASEAGPRGHELRFLKQVAEGSGKGAASRGGTITGSQPWVSLLCKFSDVAAEPENLAFFQGMYANSPAGLDHYWREQSYDKIDVVGSTAIAWVTLPQPQSFYVPTPGSGTGANLNVLFNDCTAAADPFVDFGNGGTPFVGINMMFNDLLDCCAWGGGRFATLDGISKSWRTTWNPPWSFANEGVIAHEMGHGFGLPHSNNFDDDGHPYDNRWDMMSSATGSAVSDPTYGALGKHTLSYHKNRLGWIDPPRLFEPTVDGSYEVTIDHLALASTGNYRMAILSPPSAPPYYTVEVRKRVGNYDGNLPGDAVLITEVLEGRSEPAWVVDDDVPPANTNNNEGTMWRVGETFVGPSEQIMVEVLSETTEGFVVRLTLGSPTLIFEDGFESGDTLMWP